MKITILGAGAMGMLFGGYLSQQNSVWLLDVDQGRVDKINADGVAVREKDGRDQLFRPTAVVDSAGLPVMDLVLVFVKSMFTVDALAKNRNLIGPDTYLMTLQNGAGHEAKLLQFADRAHVIIGSTQHNASVLDNGHTHHGGTGITSISLLNGENEAVAHIAENFTDCGFPCITSGDVKRQIWTKLFTNTAASALTAVLQVPLGFLYDNPHARFLMEELCREAVMVANAEGIAQFDEAEVIQGVEAVCRGAKDGYTSIYADIRDGRRTEVDTISGSVLEAAKAMGLSAPYHEMVVQMIHALEDKAAYKTSQEEKI